MKKLSFITINKKILLISLVSFLLVCLVSVGLYYNSINVSTPITQYVVVIDAGHGGIDGGVVGASGKTKESDINLAYSLCLGAYFEGLNFKVVYTRKDDNGLYSEFAKNKKVDDMKKREEIINNANADLVISMHQNGFTLPDQRGITAFYKINHQNSKDLADCIQARFQKNLEYARAEALPGDYFILNCTNTLSVLIECGFLTNPDEEVLLNDKNYMNKVCHEIFSACVMYFIESHMLTY
ncbi:MAG: N-acetylmuramoyl-L-alanine amidase [Christensenellales bacterium]